MKLALSWVQGRYWKKKIAGKQVYFKYPNTSDGYLKAVAEWAKHQEIPEPADPDENRPKLRQMVEWYENQGDPEGRGAAIRRFLDAKYQPNEHEFGLPVRFVDADTVEVIGLMVGESIVKEELANPRLWKDRLEQPAKKKSLTIKEGVKRFLADKLQQVRVEKRKASTYGTWVDRLKHVENNVAGYVDNISATTLSKYHRLLVASKFGGKRQSNIFKAFKSFVRWCWQEELLAEIPRNIDKVFEFLDDDGDRAWMLYNAEEIKSMLDKLPARGRAAVLLGANCAFTFGDLADLKKSNVDLEAGRIVYKRVKTRRRKRVPTINYRLWPETIQALKENRSDDPELWFLTEDGLPLKNSKIVDDRESKWCVLGKQWEEWKKAGIIPKKPNKGLRKTGATLIEGKFPGWEELYLGHAPTSVAGKFYVVKEGQINPDFDKILGWLRTQLLSTRSSRPAARTSDVTCAEVA